MGFVAETIGRFVVSIPLAIAITMVSFAAFAEIDASPAASSADGDRMRPALRGDEPGSDAAADPARRRSVKGGEDAPPPGRHDIGSARTRG